MRLLPLSFYALFAAVAFAERTGSIETPGEISEDAVDEAPPTVFNGVQVPPLPEIDGEKFNGTIEEGYWFVKHHS